jgi:hypothetical protein
MSDFDKKHDSDRNDEDSELNDGGSELAEAAEGGQLPYVAEENEAAERGEDQSATADPDKKADEAGRGDVVGGINMH